MVSVEAKTDLRVVLQSVSLPEDLESLVVDGWFQVFPVTVDWDSAGAGHVCRGIPSMLGDHCEHTHTNEQMRFSCLPIDFLNNEESSFG